jgi:hypothetical protein
MKEREKEMIQPKLEKKKKVSTTHKFPGFWG